MNSAIPKSLQTLYQFQPVADQTASWTILGPTPAQDAPGDRFRHAQNLFELQPVDPTGGQRLEKSDSVRQPVAIGRLSRHCEKGNPISLRFATIVSDTVKPSLLPKHHRSDKICYLILWKTSMS
jgi:hypothetical protein